MSNQQQFDRSMTGALFLNDKTGNPNRPDWRGHLEIDGLHYWASGWERKTVKGDMVISLKLELKEQSRGPQRQSLASQMNQQAKDAQYRQERRERQAAQQGGFRPEEPGDLPPF